MGGAERHEASVEQLLKAFDTLTRSVRRSSVLHGFQLDTMRDLLTNLPQRDAPGHMPDLSRETLRLHTDLAVATPGDISPDKLRMLAAALNKISNTLSATYLG